MIFNKKRDDAMRNILNDHIIITYQRNSLIVEYLKSVKIVG